MNTRPTFLSELQCRNVYRAAVFYAASAWLLVQVATQVFPFFGFANWVVRWIVIAALIGFPFVLLFAWFYEWTPEGLKLGRDVERSESITHLTGRKLDFWIIGVLAGVVALLVPDRFVVRKGDPAAAEGDRDGSAECSIGVGAFARGLQRERHRGVAIRSCDFQAR